MRRGGRARSSRTCARGERITSTATTTSTACARRRCSCARCASSARDVDWYLPDRASDGYGLSAATVRAPGARAGTRTAGDRRLRDHRRRGGRAGARAGDRGGRHRPPRAARRRRAAATRRSCIRRCAAIPAPSCARRRSPTSSPRRCSQAARRSRERVASSSEDLDLVALATIADVVPLVGENRTLARRGLRALAGTAKPGLRALMAVARVDPGKVNERAVGFALAPRLNAAGRLYRADAGARADPDRGSRARRAGRRGARPRQPRAPARRAGASASRPKRRSRSCGERALGVRARRRGLASRGDRDRRLAPGRAPPPPGGADRAGRRRRAAARGAAIEAFDLLGGLTRVRGAPACATAATAPPPAWRSSASAWQEFAAALDAHAASVLAPRGPGRASSASTRSSTATELGHGRSPRSSQALAPFGTGQPGRVADGRRRDASRRAADGRRQARSLHRRVRGCARTRRRVRHRRAAAGRRRRSRREATFTLEVNEWNGVSEPRLVLRQARPAAPTRRRAAARARLRPRELVLFVVTGPHSAPRFNPGDAPLPCRYGDRQ